MTNQNRRSFLKKGILGTGLFLLGSSKSLTSLLGTQAWGAALPMLSEKDPVAAALGYKSDASKVDVKDPRWSKKAGPDGKDQKCSTCMFYAKTDDKSGKCQIFPNNSVAAKAWCNSWSKKPA